MAKKVPFMYRVMAYYTIARSACRAFLHVKRMFKSGDIRMGDDVSVGVRASFNFDSPLRITITEVEGPE